MTTGNVYMFIVPNMIEGDITVTEETGTGISMDIPKGDMSQFTIPMSTAHSGNAFQFKAKEKNVNTEVLLNGQKVYTAYPTDTTTLTPIVAHKEGMYVCMYAVLRRSLPQ